MCCVVLDIAVKNPHITIAILRQKASELGPVWDQPKIKVLTSGKWSSFPGTVLSLVEPLSCCIPSVNFSHFDICP